MLIACLGWGAPVWDPRDLPTRGPWFGDGPFLPIEFARQTPDGCITLVLVPGKAPVRSLWTVLTANNLSEARAALAEREGVSPQDAVRYIGTWVRGDPFGDDLTERIEAWALRQGIDAVVWPALPPCFAGEAGRVPSAWEAVAHLASLSGEARAQAEAYVRRAPRQIDTDCRRYIERRLGWVALDWA